MESMDREVLETAVAWLAAGHRVHLVTVVDTWGSSPRPRGAWAALAHVGDEISLVGSVSGGCVEDDLIDRLRRGGEAGTRPEIVRYGVTQADAARFGLPCGGTLELLVEPAPSADHLRSLLHRLDGRQRIVRGVDVASGAATLRPADPADDFAFDGTHLAHPLGPRWRLLIVGAGQLSRYVAQMAVAADYAVFACDPREEYAGGWDVAGTALLRDMPDDAVAALELDMHSAVVALTHDPKLDDMALLEALKSPAFYVAALGSRASQRKRRERLALFDLTPAQIARLHGPAGLWIGSRTPPEIAISILAEMTACKYGIATPPRDDGGDIGPGCALGSR